MNNNRKPIGGIIGVILLAFTTIFNIFSHSKIDRILPDADETIRNRLKLFKAVLWLVGIVAVLIILALGVFK